MWFYDQLNALRDLIILNPLEWTVFCVIIFTFIGGYLESVFKFWNWGPQCDSCKNWTFWATSKSYCDDCHKDLVDTHVQKEHDNYYEGVCR